MLTRLTTALHGTLIFGRRVQALADNIGEMIPDGVETLLDVGCGDGTLARSITERRPEISAVGVEVRRVPERPFPFRSSMVASCRSPIDRTMS